jgi:hypothetical protein
MDDGVDIGTSRRNEIPVVFQEFLGGTGQWVSLSFPCGVSRHCILLRPRRWRRWCLRIRTTQRSRCQGSPSHVVFLRSRRRVPGWVQTRFAGTTGTNHGANDDCQARRGVVVSPVVSRHPEGRNLVGSAIIHGRSQRHCVDIFHCHPCVFIVFFWYT